MRDILQAHFNLNTHGNQETNFQLFSVILDKDNQLTQLGQYDIYFTIRNRLVAQTSICVIPKLNTAPESIVRLNPSLKLN